MADNSALFSTLIQGLAALNARAKELESDSDDLKLELNEFEGEYAKEKTLIHERIDSLNVQIFRLIKEEISKIPTPTNGKDYDEVVAKALIKAEISKLIKQRNIDVSNIKSDILEAVYKIEVPKAEDGIDWLNQNQKILQRKLENAIIEIGGLKTTMTTMMQQNQELQQKINIFLSQNRGREATT